MTFGEERCAVRRQGTGREALLRKPRRHPTGESRRLTEQHSCGVYRYRPDKYHPKGWFFFWCMTFGEERCAVRRQGTGREALPRKPRRHPTGESRRLTEQRSCGVYRYRPPYKNPNYFTAGSVFGFLYLYQRHCTLILPESFSVNITGCEQMIWVDLC